MNTNLSRIQKDIENLAKFTSTPGNGTTRFTYSKEYLDAKGFIIQEMKNAGLTVFEDAVGSVFGRIEGEPGLPTVMVGSHFDSVQNGGDFDGQAGVLCGIEVARVIKEQGLKPKYPIEFTAMVEEEGGRFGSALFASRVMAGMVSYEDLLVAKDWDGVSVADAMKSVGLDPAKVKEAARKPGSLKAFLELHIEQGPILETGGIDIGVVEYIVGLTQIVFTINGRADHAGTTPMNMRYDALAIASKLISEFPEYAVAAGEGTVATVGTFEIKPGAANIIPEKVVFTVDIRSKNENCIAQVRDQIFKRIEQLCTEGFSYSSEEKLYAVPVKMSEQIFTAYEKACDENGFSKKTMVSGAGHDAQIMSRITESGLLFVQSKDGRSHTPVEWTDYDKLQKGYEVVFAALKEIAEIQ